MSARHISVESSEGTLGLHPRDRGCRGTDDTRAPRGGAGATGGGAGDLIGTRRQRTIAAWRHHSQSCPGEQQGSPATTSRAPLKR
jgi:hypothetical protein